MSGQMSNYGAVREYRDDPFFQEYRDDPGTDYVGFLYRRKINVNRGVLESVCMFVCLSVCLSGHPSVYKILAIFVCELQFCCYKIETS